MTSCAYLGMSALQVAGADRRTAESDRPAPFSLRAALEEFREHHVRTNRNPNPFVPSVLVHPRLRSVPQVKFRVKRVLRKLRRRGEDGGEAGRGAE